MATDRYTGINAPGAHVLIASWHDDKAAAEFCKRQPPSARSLQIRVIREYGMHERLEAPHYYPEVG